MAKILLVDNEEDVIDTFKFVLENNQEDFELFFAESGYEAMEIIKKEKPQLVLSDYRMDGGDGGSLAHFCQGEDLPCVILTGFSTSDVVPYIPEGTLVMSKLEILKGRLINLIKSMLSSAA